jgi:hypothetical protein
MKDWEIIADNLNKVSWSWGCVSAVDFRGRTIWILTLIALASCETEQGTSLSRFEMHQTEIPGVCYYDEVGPSLRFVTGVNRTHDWVTFFIYSAASGGGPSLDYIVSQGMGVQTTTFSGYQSGFITNSFPRENYYWVWARRGMLRIQNGQIVPLD